MTILWTLLLPVAAYGSVWLFLGRRQSAPGSAGAIAAACACVWIGVAVPAMLLYRGNWPHSTQVAWTGLHLASGAGSGTLTIGGNRQTDVIGWPSGAFEPRVAFHAAAGEPKVQLDVSGGSAFVVEPRSEAVINGRVLAEDKPVTIDGYQFENQAAPWYLRFFQSRHVRVTRLDGLAVADFPLSKRPTNRFFGLDYLNGLSDPKQVESNAPYENWARSVLVAATKQDEIRLLDSGYSSRLSCVLPCTLDLRWRHISQRFNVTVDTLGGINVRFERPWKRTSPIPPKGVDGSWELVVTRHPEPGDFAFVLPLGGGVEDPRAALMLDDSSGTVRLRGGGADLAPAAITARDKVVTSMLSVRLGTVILDFATAVDVLSPAWVTASLLAALAVLLGGIALTRPLSAGPKQWLVYGIATVAWALLALRTALAVRYAGAPELLDRLAVSGIRLSLLAAAVLPGTLLLTAFLRAEQYGNRPPKERAASGRWAMAYLVLLLVVALFEWTAPSRIFPELPPVVAPARLGYGAFLGMVLVIGYYVICIRAVATASREPLFPFPVYRFIASGVGKDFWQGITGARRLRDLMPLIALALTFGAGLPLLLRFAAVVVSGSKIVQEIITPVIFSLIPALLWLSATVHFQRRSTQRRVWWWVVASLAAIFTVACPVVLTPLVVSDPGSMLATAAVFLPLAFVLLLSDRGRPAGFLVGSIFVLGILASIVLCFKVETVLPLGNKTVAGNVPARLFVFARASQVPQEILRRSASLEDAYEHTWENRAIAHEGGLTGLGFGNAPNRRSRIGQETLQADSVFSFFILGDHGAVGGVSLLLVYLAPFLFFLLYTNRETYLSTAFGMLIAASFFLEACAHAAMNLGILPFAGRNLPLLATNSQTDVLKWLCLLTIAAQTPFWSLAQSALGVTAVRTRPAIFSPRAQPWAKVVLGALMVFVIGAVAVAAARVIHNPEFGEPFTWDSVLSTVQQLAESRELTVGPNLNVTLRNPQAIGEGSLLVRELHAFNQLDVDEKLGEPPPGQLSARLFSIRTVDDFNNALREESASQFDRPRGRPPLFRLVELPKFADEAGEIPIVGETHRVIPNALFNTRISFRTAPTEELPVMEWSARQWGTFVLRGAGFTIVVPRRLPELHENRVIDLEPGRDGGMVVAADTKPDSPRGDIWLRVPVGRGMRRKLFARFVVEGSDLYLDDPPGGFRLRVGRAGTDIHVSPRDHVKLDSGDSVRIPVEIGVQPQFNVEQRNAMPLIGPAWVGGLWQMASDSISPFPWTTYLRSGLEREWERMGPAQASARYRTLTVRQDLQRSAQAHVAAVARMLHSKRLAAFASLGGRRPTVKSLRRVMDLAMPPRVGLAVLRLPGGDVLAIAGSPRMSAGDIGSSCDGGSWCPPHGWIDEGAPSSIRVRYGSDRNFDPIEMGSSTKPLFAAAALAVHPGLDEHLHVSGPKENEKEVFGIPVTVKTGWLARVSPRWTDFRRYLAESDNRYHVRLGFLALAEATPSGFAVENGVSSSDRESMDGVNAWHRYPRFPALMQFSSRQPLVMQRIDDAPFATTFRSMFNVGVRQGDFLARRYSFWTGNEGDDLPRDRKVAATSPSPVTTTAAPSGVPPAEISHVFDVLSPEIASLAFDYVREPRQFVSLLLGGNENRWANVDFAGAFATAVTGHPVVPHILPSVVPAPTGRKVFPAVAARLRPGLQGVVTEGTAKFVRDGLVPPQLRAIPDLKVYAKTGTLAVEEGHATTSRLVIAFIRWQNEGTGVVQRGVVLSMVGEYAQIGDAARWLAAYITENADAIARELQ